MSSSTCYHCGTNSKQKDTLFFDEKCFCCYGCKTVYEIFLKSDLISYYNFEKTPGHIPNIAQEKYDCLDNEQITEDLLEFQDEKISIVSLCIPVIHCSSCIWILEHLYKLNPYIYKSQVHFQKKRVCIHFGTGQTSLKEIVLLLCKIGYEPYLSLESNQQKDKTDNSLIYKLGIAGFAFGNIMLLSFPEYFQIDEIWLNRYKPIFRYLMLFLSLPVLLYCAKDYFQIAYKGLKNKFVNMDIPIALGIVVLFLRSFLEIILQQGQGYLDSFSGLVFFLLLGRFFQQKTYDYLSFERDYKSYFPLAVIKIENEKEFFIPINKVQKGDNLLIKNGEIIPVDGILLEEKALIDYSFVTGESIAVERKINDKIFCGGKQCSGSIQIQAIKSVSQSYLTQLWSNVVFEKNKTQSFKNITDSISKYFTSIVLLIAFFSAIYWFFVDIHKVIEVIGAVLIVACPCALALSAPFALGNMIRILGKKSFYLKDVQVIERLCKIRGIIFDKTGTITTTKKQKITYKGQKLTPMQQAKIGLLLKQSNHPLGNALYEYLSFEKLDSKNLQINNFKEIIGQGLEAKISGDFVRIGKLSFVGLDTAGQNTETCVAFDILGQCKGVFYFKNKYRKGIFKMFTKLSKRYELTILSGDNASEKGFLKKRLPSKTLFKFNQKPQEKLEFIAQGQKNNQSILMIGDGLNDAGALAQSDVGIAVSENTNIFTPSCDAIIDATMLCKLPQFLRVSHYTLRVIKYSFALSFLYNIVGIYFAVTGALSPIIAAILMPVSSISVVVFTTLTVYCIGKKI